MEELLTTEVLDREILDDARKRAYRILKTADDSLASQKKDWEKKLASDLDSIRNFYSERLKKSTEEIFARLPLDFRRLKLKTHEEYLSTALNGFLKGLEREKLLLILEEELLERLKTVSVEAAINDTAGNGGNFSAVVRYSALSLSETQAILNKAQLSGDWEFQEALAGDGSSNEQSDQTEFPAIVVDAKVFRLTASIETAAAALLRDNREELAVALLGTEVIDD